MKIKIVLFVIFTTILTNTNAGDDPEIPTQEQYAQALLSALGASGPRLNQMVRALAAYCGTEENYFTGMAGNCDDLFLAALNGNGAIVKRVLRRLRPREVVQSARTSVEIISTQQANIASRMAQVRAGVGNSIAGLNIESSDGNIPLSLLTYLDDESSKGILDSPWGFFINGQISSGDYAYADASDEGFDFDTNGVTAGVDYRFNSKTVAGVAIGYADFDSNVGQDAQMQSTAMTFSAYGSFNINTDFYVDARASYGRPEFDQTRIINFNINGNQTDQVAIGETDGTQQSFIISTGYQFSNNNGWQFTPSASLEYSKTQVDAFVETQAGAWNVGFSEQNFKTTRFTLGFQANKAISLSNGVLIPSVGYQFIHENQNGDDFILMRISGMPPGEFFEVSTEFNDADYSSANLGLTYVSSNGKQAFIQYAEVFGWDGFDRGTLNLGARFEF